jgi:hypothetical protein
MASFGSNTINVFGRSDSFKSYYLTDRNPKRYSLFSNSLVLQDRLRASQVLILNNNISLLMNILITLCPELCTLSWVVNSQLYTPNGCVSIFKIPINFYRSLFQGIEANHITFVRYSAVLEALRRPSWLLQHVRKDIDKTPIQLHVWKQHRSSQN